MSRVVLYMHEEEEGGGKNQQQSAAVIDRFPEKKGRGMLLTLFCMRFVAVPICGVFFGRRGFFLASAFLRGFKKLGQKPYGLV